MKSDKILTIYSLIITTISVLISLVLMLSNNPAMTFLNKYSWVLKIAGIIILFIILFIATKLIIVFLRKCYKDRIKPYIINAFDIIVYSAIERRQKETRNTNNLIDDKIFIEKIIDYDFGKYYTIEFKDNNDKIVELWKPYGEEKDKGSFEVVLDHQKRKWVLKTTCSGIQFGLYFDLIGRRETCEESGAISVKSENASDIVIYFLLISKNGGQYFIEYNTEKNAAGNYNIRNEKYYYFPLDVNYKDGNWHTIKFHFMRDLLSMEDIEITQIKRIYIRGCISLNKIVLF